MFLFSKSVMAAAKFVGKSVRARMLLAAVTCLAAFGLSARPAAAQQFVGEFGRAANQKFTGDIQVVDKIQNHFLTGHVGWPIKASVNIRPALRTAMANAVRPKLQETIRAELPKHKMSGFTPYVIRFSNGSSWRDELYVGTDGSGFTMKYLVKGSTVRIGFHTPDIAFGIGLGRGANPEFDVPYDVEITTDVQTTLRGPEVRSVKVRLIVGRPQGANFTGDVADAIGGLIRFFGGPDFVGIAQNRINSQQVTVASSLRADMGRLGLGFRSLSSDIVVRPVYSSGRLNLELHKGGPAPVIH